MILSSHERLTEPPFSTSRHPPRIICRISRWDSRLLQPFHQNRYSSKWFQWFSRIGRNFRDRKMWRFFEPLTKSTFSQPRNRANSWFFKFLSSSEHFLISVSDLFHDNSENSFKNQTEPSFSLFFCHFVFFLLSQWAMNLFGTEGGRRCWW